MTAQCTHAAGLIAQMLSREPSDAEQLLAVASVLNVLRECVRDTAALERIDWLLLDLKFFADARAFAERSAEAEGAR